MRVSIAVCEAPEQTEKSSAELFSHVSADASGPRETLRLADRLSIADELWFMPSGQGTRTEGLRPELVLRAAVRAGHKIRSQRRSLCFL